MSGSELGAEDIDRALRLLAGKVRAAGLNADIYVFGGAAMILTFADRPTTHDIDAVFRPDTAVRQAADDVAHVLGLPRSWLNDQGSAYLPSGREPNARLFGDFGGVRITTASPEMLLALKLRAARRRDDGDLRRLVGHLGLTAASEALAVHDRFFPDDPLGERQRAVLADLFDTLG